MQNHQDQMEESRTSDRKPLRRWVILMLSIAVLIIIIFVAFVGLKVLDLLGAEATSTLEVGELSPDLQATATAGCILFMQQFPGTPCPDVDPQSIVETATAACRLFNSQFPGTPCP